MAGTSDRGANTVVTARRVVAAVLFAVFIVFILQNRPDVTVQLLALEVTGPIWVVLLGSFAVGGLVVWLVLARRRR